MLPTEDDESERFFFFRTFSSSIHQFLRLKLNHKMISYACNRVCSLTCYIIISRKLFNFVFHSVHQQNTTLHLNTVLDAAILITITVQLIMMMLSVMMMTQVAVTRHICIPFRTQMMMVNMCRIRNGWTR